MFIYKIKRKSKSLPYSFKLKPKTQIENLNKYFKISSNSLKNAFILIINMTSIQHMNFYRKFKRTLRSFNKEGTR